MFARRFTLVQSNAEHHQRNGDEVHRGRELPQHDDADDRRSRRQQRDEQRIGRAREPRHGELVEHVGNHR